MTTYTQAVTLTLDLLTSGFNGRMLAYYDAVRPALPPDATGVTTKFDYAYTAVTSDYAVPLIFGWGVAGDGSKAVHCQPLYSSFGTFTGFDQSYYCFTVINDDYGTQTGHDVLQGGYPSQPNDFSSLVALPSSDVSGYVFITTDTSFDPAHFTVTATVSYDSAVGPSAAAPTIASLTPPSGPTAGATVVVVTGTGLTGATAVSFGGTPATSFTVDSATQITAVAPAHTAGDATVTVVTPGGTSGGLTYQYVAPTALAITSLSLAYGPVAGGNLVHITGTSLGDVSAVWFGTTPATSFTVDSPTSIHAYAPPGAAGTTYVRVTSASLGLSTTGPASLYTYLAPQMLTLALTSRPSFNSAALDFEVTNPVSSAFTLYLDGAPLAAVQPGTLTLTGLAVGVHQAYVAVASGSASLTRGVSSDEQSNTVTIVVGGAREPTMSGGLSSSASTFRRVR